MFNKKYIVNLDSQTKDTTFPLIVSLDKKQIELLEKHGYDAVPVVSVQSYVIPRKENFTPFKLKASLIAQDFLRFRFFNPSRNVFYYHVLENVYKVSLTEKQKKDKEKAIKALGEDNIDNIYTANLSSSTDNNITTVLPVETHSTKIILLASSGAGVGKSVTANTITEEFTKLNYKSRVLPFAYIIRKHVECICGYLFLEKNPYDPELYKQFKNVAYRYDSNFEPFVSRNLLCDYSDFLQKHFGADVWAKQFSMLADSNSLDYIVVDDFRRLIEYEYLVQHYGKDNILTIYLNKPDLETNTTQWSESSQSYEGLLDPKDFDIVFDFNSDWSNTDELVNKIKAHFNLQK